MTFACFNLKEYSLKITDKFLSFASELDNITGRAKHAIRAGIQTMRLIDRSREYLPINLSWCNWIKKERLLITLPRRYSLK